jgi:hypothetical protein
MPIFDSTRFLVQEIRITARSVRSNSIASMKIRFKKKFKKNTSKAGCGGRI